MEVGHLGAGGGVRRLATIRGMAVQVMDMRIVCQRQSQDASSGLAHKTDCAEWRMARMSVVSIFRPCEKNICFSATPSPRFQHRLSQLHSVTQMSAWVVRRLRGDFGLGHLDSERHGFTWWCEERDDAIPNLEHNLWTTHNDWERLS